MERRGAGLPLTFGKACARKPMMRDSFPLLTSSKVNKLTTLNGHNNQDVGMNYSNASNENRRPTSSWLHEFSGHSLACPLYLTPYVKEFLS